MSGLGSDWSLQSTGPGNRLVSAMTDDAELHLLGVGEEVSVIYHQEGYNPVTAIPFWEGNHWLTAKKKSNPKLGRLSYNSVMT